ncbi:sulfatase [Fodinibius roseus]|nr:sulfatase [Fodinibius roseus]
MLQGQDKPNVVLIIADDLNTRIGPYMDIDHHTPNLDRLAREGVRFTRAYAQYPICGPSRASLMSGLYPETNGVLGNSTQLGSYKKKTPDLSDHPSMAGFFRQQGYYTARVSKIFHMGVPGGIERGGAGGDDPDSWDYAYNVMGPETLGPGQLELLSPDNHHYGGNFSRMVIADSMKHTQTDYLAASQAIAVLENRTGDIAEGATNLVREKPDAPFFLAVGFVRPHVPFIAPRSSFQSYPEEEVVLPPGKVDKNVPDQALRQQNDNKFGMNEWQKRQVISGYMASVRFMDRQVGRILDALDRLEVREETIVVFLSDHGYNLGEHDSWSKISLWEGSARVPLILSVPGRKYQKNYGKKSRQITELIDLYPTLTDLTGYAGEVPTILQGKSLVRHLTEKEPGLTDQLAYTVSYQGNAASIRTERWRYTRWGDEVQAHNEELYDHKNDPEEYDNLADDAGYRDILEKMRKTFNVKQQDVQDARFWE